MSLTSVFSRFFKGEKGSRTLDVLTDDLWTAADLRQINTGRLLIWRHSEGQLAPDACVSWQEEGARWTFTLKPGLDAELYRQGLLKRLAELAAIRLSFPPFDRLLGFVEFSGGQREALGLSAPTTDTLVFEFDQSPGEELLQALASPDLEIAPGPYQPTVENPWVLTQAVATPGAQSFDRVRLLAGELQAAEDGRRQTLICAEDLPSEKPGFKRWQEPLTVLGSLVIRPIRDMQNQRLRQILADKVYEVAARNPFAQASHLVFPNLPGATVKRDPHPRKIKLQQALKIQIPAHQSKPSLLYMEATLLKALEELGWPSELERVELAAPQGTGPIADIRLQLNEVGSNLEPWTVSLNCLSPTGAQFPDPSGRLKQATKLFLNKELSFEAFVQEFNQAIHDDAAVVPMLHTSRSWLYSDDLESFSPRFSELRLAAVREK